MKIVYMPLHCHLLQASLENVELQHAGTCVSSENPFDNSLKTLQYGSACEAV